VQNELLGKHPSAGLVVDVVWLPMLPGDSAQLIDRRVLSDPRVTYYWDPGRTVGAWFSRNVTHKPGITWDAYFLYGPQATWGSVPAPLVSRGSSVIGTQDRLLSDFDRLEAAGSARGAG
jgi:hypothetical protein